MDTPPLAPARGTQRQPAAERFAFGALAAMVTVVPLEGLLVVRGVSIVRCGGAIAVFAAVAAVMGGTRPARPGPLLVAVGAFAFWSMASWLWSIDRGLTADRMVTVIQIVVLAALVHTFVRTAHQRELLLLALLLGVAVASVDAVINLVTDDRFREGPNARYSGADLNPIVFGGLVAVATVIAWWVVRVDRRRWLRIVSGVYVVASPALVILTFSRTAVIAGAVALGLIAFEVFKHGPRRWLLVLPALALPAIVVVTTVEESSANRILDPLFGRTSGSVDYREDAAAAVIDIVERRPLHGVGAGAYSIAAGQVNDVAHGANNTFLSVLGELGFVGLALFGAVLLLCARTAARRFREGTWVDLWMLAIWLVMALFLHSEFEKWTWVIVLLAGAELFAADEAGGVVTADRSWRTAYRLIAAKRQFALLCLAALIAGVLEAGLLVTVVKVAVSIASGADRVEVDLLGLEAQMTTSAIVAVALLLATTKLAAGWAAARLTARLTTDAIVGLRTRLFSASAAASWERQAREPIGRVQELLGGHASQAAGGVSWLSVGAVAAANFAALVAVAFIVHPTSALVILAAVLVLALLVRPLTQLARRAMARSAEANLAYASRSVELTSLGLDVTAFDVATEVGDSMKNLVADVARPFEQARRLGRLLPELYTTSALVLLFACLLVADATLSARFGSLGAVVVLLVRALTRAQAAQSAFHHVHELEPFAEGILERTAEFEAAAHVGRGGSPLEHATPMELAEVGYEYLPGRPVLNGVSIRINAGDALAVVGPSGSGKSTLLQVLLRLREPTTGRYLVDGVDAAEVSLTDFRRRVAFVPQEPRLVTASVSDNIRFFRPWIEEHDVRRAAAQAHLDQDIAGWEDGFDTIVGERGRGLSGGQRQRVCLARALAGRPEVLLLDEPSSALDLRSEELLGETLAELSGEVTLVIVAHRPSTLTVCRWVLVLVGGRIESLIPADEMTGISPYYRAETSPG